jgi:hypothetical protein
MHYIFIKLLWFFFFFVLFSATGGPKTFVPLQPAAVYQPTKTTTTMHRAKNFGEHQIVVLLRRYPLK